MNSVEQSLVERLLYGSGITLNGSEHHDPRVYDNRFYGEVLRRGTLGLGEAYQAGWWDVDDLPGLIARAFTSGLRDRLRFSVPALVVGLAGLCKNLQRGQRAWQVGEQHYDAGNDLYAAMLDRRMVYSCADWSRASTLAEAQEAKLDLICRKLGLQPRASLLDIGCGWGSLLEFAAERYGALGVGITISREQAELAAERCRKHPVTIRLLDYRAVEGRYDRVASVGMFEHVGMKNYRTFMQSVANCLAPDGVALVHTIGSRRSVHSTDPWIGRYIFPNSMLPSLAQITRAAEGVLDIRDVDEFGAHYEQTLLAWCRNLEAAWPELVRKNPHRYDERFRRTWRYYLLTSAGMFRSGEGQVWQIVLTHPRATRQYRGVR